MHCDSGGDRSTCCNITEAIKSINHAKQRTLQKLGCIYFSEKENKTKFTEKDFRRFANKLQNSQKVMYTKINLAKTYLRKTLFLLSNKRNPNGYMV